MVHSYGLRSGTRHLFAKKFRKHGMPNISSSLRTYKVGDYVDVVADSAVRKGMPHKYYHGRTGIVWNVTPRGVGVIINKPVGNRCMRKRICVRAEHIRNSRCREQFQKKVAAYQNFVAAKKAGKPLAAKKSSRGARMVRHAKVETLGRAFADYEIYNSW